MAASPWRCGWRWCRRCRRCWRCCCGWLCKDMDFKAFRDEFHLPVGMIYLDGNSLGPLPKTAADRVARTVRDEWGDMLITGWNRAGWMDMPTALGDRIG